MPIMMSPTATIRMVSARAPAERASGGAVGKADPGLCARAGAEEQRLARTMRRERIGLCLAAGLDILCKLALPLGSERVCLRAPDRGKVGPNRSSVERTERRQACRFLAAP